MSQLSLPAAPSQKKSNFQDLFSVKVANTEHLFHLLYNHKIDQFVKFFDEICKIVPSVIDINLPDANGNYLIFVIVQLNRLELLNKILTTTFEEQLRLDYLDIDGFTILFYPIRHNFLEIFELLLWYDKNKLYGSRLIDLIDKKKNSALAYCIKYNNLACMMALLQGGCDPDYVYPNGSTILHKAIKLRKTRAFMEPLLKYTKNIDIVNKSTGLSPLLTAVYLDNLETTQTLINHGANQNIVDKDHLSIGHIAVCQRYFRLFKLFDKLDYEIQDLFGETILHYAIEFDFIEFVDAILSDSSRFSNFSLADRNGNTIFHELLLVLIGKLRDGVANIAKTVIATQERFIKIILNKVDLNYQDNNGNTGVHLLVMLLGLPSMAGERLSLLKRLQQILILKKINLFMKNRSGDTAMKILTEIVVSYKGSVQKDSFFFDQFIEICCYSYLNQLSKNPNNWKVKWQNDCSRVQSKPQLQAQIGSTQTTVQKTTQSKCFDLVKKTILTDQVSVPIKKSRIIVRVIDVPKQDEKKPVNSFLGTILDISVGFTFLNKKYPSVFVHYPPSRSISDKFSKYCEQYGFIENPNQNVMQFEIRWIFQTIFYPPNFAKSLSKAIASGKYSYFIFAIGITLDERSHTNGLFLKREWRGSGVGSTSAPFPKEVGSVSNKGNNDGKGETWICERFEPYGKNYPYEYNYNPDLLDTLLQTKLLNILNKVLNSPTFVYRRPKDYLPTIGFQILEQKEAVANKNLGDPDGYCSLWTIWFLDHRIYQEVKVVKKVTAKTAAVAKGKSRQVHTSKFVIKLINYFRMNNMSFKDTIRKYSVKITKMRDAFLKKLNLSFQEYLNDQLSSENLDLLFEEIVAEAEPESEE